MGQQDDQARQIERLEQALARARSEVWELRESEAVRRAVDAETLYQLIATQFPGGVFLFDHDRTYLAAAGRELVEAGWDADALIGTTPVQSLGVDAGSTIEGLIDDALRDGRVVRDLDVGERMFETTFVRVDGNLSSPKVLAISVDVTDRRAVEAQRARELAHKEALLREVHHRVKNNLQSVQSLLSLASRRVRDPDTREVMQDLGARVRSMATVHELLYDADEQSIVRLDQVVAALMGHLERSLPALGAAEVVVELEPVEWETAGTLEIGLILTELVSNAARHALAMDGGTLWVTLVATPEGMRLTVADDGPGLVEHSTDGEGRRPMGLWLVRTLAARLGSRLEHQDADGTRWTLAVRRRS